MLLATVVSAAVVVDNILPVPTIRAPMLIPSEALTLRFIAISTGKEELCCGIVESAAATANTSVAASGSIIIGARIAM